jgi:hypothetical protein
MNERIRLFAEQCVGSRPYNTFDYEKFAALVAAAEREACAELCEEHIGEDLYDMFGKHLAKQCAEAIRERNEQ